MRHAIFTIGHSTHSIEKFIEFLKLHNVEVIADVRSSPFSKMNPQFNRENLQKSLSNEHIRYVFLGKELGARSEDPECYVNDKVQYKRLAKTELFISGVKRLLKGQKTFRIALMCAEKEPLDCHRTILVARELCEKGVSVMHILSSGKIEDHKDTISRLKMELGISNNDMFLSVDNSDDIAYDKQAEKIAYSRSRAKLKHEDQRSFLVDLE